MLKIYGRANAWNVRKVTFLMEDLGLHYTREDYGRGFASTSSPEFLAVNPNGMVPVLFDGDFALWESHSIMRYIGAKYAPETYYPKDIEARARVDQWLDWKSAQIAPPMRPLFFTHVLNSTDFTPQQMAEAEADWAKYFTVLDGQLAKTGAFVTGPNMTIADAALGMAVHRFLNLPITRPDTPHVVRYYKMLSERPSYQKTVLIGLP